MAGLAELCYVGRRGIEIVVAIVRHRERELDSIVIGVELIGLFEEGKSLGDVVFKLVDEAELGGGVRDVDLVVDHPLIFGFGFLEMAESEVVVGCGFLEGNG